MTITPNLSTGAARIVAERNRQMTDEEWTPEHDDEHVDCQLADAAVAYAEAAAFQVTFTKPARALPPSWPWNATWWKPSPDPIRNLEKAGALIAAEIDRLLRSRGEEGSLRPGGDT